MGKPILSFEKGRDFDTSVAVAAAVRKKNKILTAAGALMANINLFFVSFRERWVRLPSNRKNSLKGVIYKQSCIISLSWNIQN